MLLETIVSCMPSFYVRHCFYVVAEKNVARARVAEFEKVSFINRLILFDDLGSELPWVGTGSIKPYFAGGAL